MMANLKASLLPGGVLCKITFYKASTCITNELSCQNVWSKVYFHELMLLIPVYDVFNFDCTRISKEAKNHLPGTLFCCESNSKFSRGTIRRYKSKWLVYV